jgi:hypothetical protein
MASDRSREWLGEVLETLKFAYPDDFDMARVTVDVHRGPRSLNQAVAIGESIVGAAGGDLNINRWAETAGGAGGTVSVSTDSENVRVAIYFDPEPPADEPE